MTDEETDIVALSKKERALLWYLRLRTRLAGYPPIYGIRYRGRTTMDWTFQECCKVMRLIPVTDSMEILLSDGRVHFTLPARKE